MLLYTFYHYLFIYFKGLQDLKDVLAVLALVLLHQHLRQHVVAVWDKFISCLTCHYYSPFFFVNKILPNLYLPLYVIKINIKLFIHLEKKNIKTYTIRYVK